LFFTNSNRQHETQLNSVAVLTYLLETVDSLTKLVDTITAEIMEDCGWCRQRGSYM